MTAGAGRVDSGGLAARMQPVNPGQLPACVSLLSFRFFPLSHFQC